MKKSRKLLMILGIVLSLAVATGTTLAYLTDTDSDVNVMTLGNVSIKQIEKERIEQSDDNTADTNIQDFTQGKPLYPSVYDDQYADWARDEEGNQVYQGFPTGGFSAMWTDEAENAVDKIVFVENDGKSDAYVRTWFAFEQGSMTAEEFEAAVGQNINNTHWVWEDVAYGVEIDGNKYAVKMATYKGSDTVHPGGILPAGETTRPSLLQTMLYKTVTNEDCEAIDGNKNGTYDILVFSQAVQTAGFDKAKDALDEAFKPATAANHPWVDGVDFPEIFSWQGVNYITTGDEVDVVSDGGDTLYRGIISDGLTTATNVNIREGIVRLNNRAICKAPTIANVTLPKTLTYIDESAFQQSGITSIEVPENVTYIGFKAFDACYSLETVVIKAKDVTIANYVARGCPALKEVYIYSDSVTFESGSMYFTNKQDGNASGITFYVPNQAMADNLYKAFSTSHHYGLLIKNLDGTETYYNTLK